MIESLFVHGESTESHLVAIIVPNHQSLQLFLKNTEINYETPIEELVINQTVRKLFLNHITSWIKKEGDLKGFEIVKDISLVAINFDDAGLLTPTFKLKRHDAKVKYLIYILISCLLEILRRCNSRNVYRHEFCHETITQ